MLSKQGGTESNLEGVLVSPAPVRSEPIAKEEQGGLSQSLHDKRFSEILSVSVKRLSEFQCLFRALKWVKNSGHADIPAN